MALVVLPEGTQISGSIGGTTWSRNRYGAYKRSRSVPVNPNTARQVAVRNALRALAIAWHQTLTQPQRDAWTLYGANVNWQNRLGQSINLTGLSQYIRSNTQLVINGSARVDDAPGIFTLAAAELALAVTASEATQLLSVAFDDTQPWASEDDAHQFVQMGSPQNPATVYFGGPYRVAGTIDGDLAIPITSPQTITAPFPFVAGQRIWVRTRIIRADGRLSEFAEVNFLGAA